MKLFSRGIAPMSSKRRPKRGGLLPMAVAGHMHRNNMLRCCACERQGAMARRMLMLWLRSSSGFALLMRQPLRNKSRCKLG